MRTRFLFLACCAVLGGAAFAIEACGGSSDDTGTTTTDAGADVAADVQKDTGPVVEEDAATCDLSRDFLADIPDASIADGASTSGVCLGCAKSKCGSDIEDCKLDCPCQDIAADALECYTKNAGNVLACAADLASKNPPKKTRDIAISLFTCLNSSCKTECATDQFQQDGGADGGDGG